MALIVQKFGGSSVANAERLKNVAEIIAREYTRGNKVVVVVSAQGDMTDRLIEKAAEITARPSRREMDVLLSTGEQASIALTAMALGEAGCPAVSLCGWQAAIATDGTHGNARIKSIDKTRIERELERDKVVIVAGFQGISGGGDITTIGRGGSDTTAVSLAAALRADSCRIYTDVDGVYSADPQIIRNAKKHYEIGYDEMLELASLGAQVLHNRSVEMAKRFGVQLEVLSSFRDVVGTKVREVIMEQKNVSGVARDPNVALVRVEGFEDRPGVVYRIFTALSDHKVVIDTILQSGNEADRVLWFTVAKKSLPVVVETLNESRAAIGFSTFGIDENICKLSVVGAGMMNSVGVAAKVFEALYRAGVNIRHITTSEIKISVIIAMPEAEKATQAVHDAFFA